jgi:hypothetical protein
MSVHLLPLQGGEPVEVREGLTLLGRDGHCDVRLLGVLVSRVHCVLASVGGCLLVRDLGSTNGTRVNGVRVRRAQLRAQDVLCVGEMVFLVATGCERPPDAPGPVNGGTVTFKVYRGATQIGTAVTSGTASNGKASADYVLPGGTALGPYTIVAAYNPSPNYTGSSDGTHTLDVGLTDVFANDTFAPVGTADQNVTLTAQVLTPSTGVPVNGGTVTFRIFSAACRSARTRSPARSPTTLPAPPTSCRGARQRASTPSSPSTNPVPPSRVPSTPATNSRSA